MPKKKVRSDMKIGEVKQHRRLKSVRAVKRVPEIGVTRKEFHDILDRASQPINREAESDSGKSGT
jgi:hypothetical protein